MRFKHTLQTVALSLSLSLGLGLFLLSLPARAQTGGPVLVNGTNYVPTSGTTIETVTDGSASSAVRVVNRGTLFGADNWTLSSSGNTAYGIHVQGTSAFSGTNLNITTTGTMGHGVFVNITSTATLTGGTVATEGDGANGLYANAYSSLTASGVSVSTSGSSATGIFANGTSTFSGTNLSISTTGQDAYGMRVSTTSSGSLTGGTLATANATAYGLLVNYSSTATLTNVAVNVAGDLVRVGGDGVNTVTLDNVHGAIGGNVFNASGAITNTLSIQNSSLSGNLASSAGDNTVNLVGGTLTGAAKWTAGTLNVNVDNASKWIVNASSTMNALSNQGAVDMSTGGALRNLSVTDFTQSAGASIAMTLAGNGGAANELVNVNGQLTLAGALVLNGYAGLAAASSVDGGTFVLFAGAASVSGAFTDIQLNGVSYGAVADGGTFTDGTYTYTLSYQGDAATGALTGGNDVLLHVIPEPGTWAMLVGGLSLLACGQRLRRRSRG